MIQHPWVDADRDGLLGIRHCQMGHTTVDAVEAWLCLCVVGGASGILMRFFAPRGSFCRLSASFSRCLFLTESLLHRLDNHKATGKLTTIVHIHAPNANQSLVLGHVALFVGQGLEL